MYPKEINLELLTQLLILQCIRSIFQMETCFLHEFCFFCGDISSYSNITSVNGSLHLNTKIKRPHLITKVIMYPSLDCFRINISSLSQFRCMFLPPGKLLAVLRDFLVHGTQCVNRILFQKELQFLGMVE